MKRQETAPSLNKGLKDTIVIWTCLAINGRSLEITHTDPLKTRPEFK